jgi:hypothetical protein
MLPVEWPSNSCMIVNGICASFNSVAKECLQQYAMTLSSILECDEIYNSIDDWCKVFFDVCTLYKKSYPSHSPTTRIKGPNVSMRKISPETKKYLPTKSPSICIMMSTLNIESYASSKDLDVIFTLVKCDRKIRTGYKFLIQAYRQEYLCNYRFTAMQALTAVECSMDELIHEKCSKLGINAEVLLGSISLGNKFDILLALGSNWSVKNPKGKITEFRNKLYHNRLIEPKKEEVRNILDYIEKYLIDIIPDYYSDNLVGKSKP